MAEYPPTGFPLAAGASNFGPTGNMLYIVPKFAPRLLRKFYEMTAFGEVTNDDYVGVVKRGGSVTIRKRPTIAVNKLTAGSMAIIQSGVESDVVTMNIDKGFQYGFPIDAIQKQQADVEGWEGEWEDDAMQNMATSIETDFLSSIVTTVDATMTGNLAGAKSAKIDLGSSGTPLAFDATNAVSYMIRARTAMKENKGHGVKPWIFLPPWATGEVLQANLVQAIYTGDGESPLRKEEMQDQCESKAIGRLGGMHTYESNLIYNTGGIWYCPFGCREAVTFATQMQVSERLMNPFAFGEIQRGFQVYGYKATIPTLTGVLMIRQGTNQAQS